MIYPHYDIEKSELVDGSIFTCGSICKQHKERCQKYYNSLHNQGASICPYGYTTILKGDLIISGIGVEGFCAKSKIKKNGYTSRFISYNELMEIINLEYEKAQNYYQIRKLEGLVLELFHDVRKVNGTAKYNCEELLDSTDENDTKRKALLNILDASNLISLRLDYYQFVVNPNSPIRTERIGIYRIFEKCIQSFKNITLPRYITFNLGKCWKGVEGQRILSLVPYVILENAIKYAPNNSEISISFIEQNDLCTVIVSSLGPRVEATELDLIFKSGYRGVHAVENRSITGAGLGLSIVKDICSRHGFDVYARSMPQAQPTRHSEFYQFSVSVVFRNTYSLQD